LPKGNILKHGASGRGYASVTLSMHGVSKHRYVHHLVAAAFIGPRPDGLDICHNNGDIRDPRASNLRYDTRNANMRDSLKHGTHRSVTQLKCPEGHDLTPENVYRRYYTAADGGAKYRDRCKACMKVKSKHDYELWKARHAA